MRGARSRLPRSTWSRVEFDGKPFSLATHVVATIAKGKSTDRWEAEYSACHLFEVTVKVGFGGAVRPGWAGGSGRRSPAA